MDFFKTTSPSTIIKLINSTSKGIKFGENVETLSSWEELGNQEAKFVLLGLPTLSMEDNIVSFKHSNVFLDTLEHLLSTQDNRFNSGNQLLVLGEVDHELLLEKLNQFKTNSEKIKLYYQTLDVIIQDVIIKIFAAEKIPIIVGGCHKSFDLVLKSIHKVNEKGSNALEMSSRINLNIEDSDQLKDQNYFTPTYLNKYYAFGVHSNYISESEFEFFDTHKNLNYYLYEDCLHLTTLDKCIRLKNAIDFLKGNLGFKLDFASIQGLSAELEVISGFSVRDMRTFIKIIRKESTQFFQISGFQNQNLEGQCQLLSYLITDFVRKD